MNQKISIALKKRWADIPPEERSRIMSERARQRARSMTPEQRKNHAIKMSKKSIESFKNKRKDNG